MDERYFYIIYFIYNTIPFCNIYPTIVYYAPLCMYMYWHAVVFFNYVLIVSVFLDFSVLLLINVFRFQISLANRWSFSTCVPSLWLLSSDWNICLRRCYQYTCRFLMEDWSLVWAHSLVAVSTCQLHFCLFSNINVIISCYEYIFFSHWP